MRIKESELIINEGRIYHLGLAPEELGDVIITVGDPDRVERVSRHFDSIEYTGRKREFLTHTGYIGNKRLSVIGTGIGPDNIDILINEIDALKNIDFSTRQVKEKLTQLRIIRMGTSGAIRPEIPVDSIVCSSHGLGLDGVLNFYRYSKTDFQTAFILALKESIPALFELCSPYLFAGDTEMGELLAPEDYSGVTITSGGFYAPQGRALRLDNHMRSIVDQLRMFEFKGLHPVNFEMETSAIYGLAGLLGHRALSINAIIANRANGTFSKNPYVTIDRMIAKTLERIVELPTGNS